MQDARHGARHVTYMTTNLTTLQGKYQYIILVILKWKQNSCRTYQGYTACDWWEPVSELDLTGSKAHS